MKRMLLLGFIIMMLPQIVLADFTYDETTETYCDNGKCTKTLYSGYSPSFFNNVISKEQNWLKYYNIVYLERDKDYDIVIKSFNSTDFDFTLKTADALKHENLPLKLCNYEYDEKTGESEEVCYQMNYRMNAVSRDFRLGLNPLSFSFIRFGLNSTTIMLQDADSENLDDTYTNTYGADDDDEYGSCTSLPSQRITNTYNQYLKFNLSIPIGSIIESAVLAEYLGGEALEATNWEDLGAYNIYNNFTIDGVEWLEGDECDNVAENGEMNENEEPKNASVMNMTYESSIRVNDGDTGTWKTWNVTNMVKKTFEDGYNNVSISLRVYDGYLDADDWLWFPSKEYTTDTSLRPYLNITYSEGEEPAIYERVFNIDSQGDVDFNRTYISGEINPPQWNLNSTNSTLAGTSIEHRLKWEDDNGLSGYIFSFDNGTGTLNNDSFVKFGEITEYNSLWNDLVALYHLDEDDGTIAEDSYNSLDGNNTNISWNDGKIGKGAYFNKTSFINIGNNTDFDLGNKSFSISCWFYTTNISRDEGNYDLIQRYQKHAYGYRSFTLMIDADATDRLYFILYNSTNLGSASTTYAIQANQWYFITGVYNYTHIIVYVNDTLAGATSWFNGTNYNNSVNITFGGSPEIMDDASYGTLDEIGLWNRALTFDEVKDLYYLGKDIPFIGWSNVTKVVNSTVGSTIAWKVYANDSSDNWNVSDVFTYDTTSVGATYERIFSPYLEGSSVFPDRMIILGRVFDAEGMEEVGFQRNIGLERMLDSKGESDIDFSRQLQFTRYLNIESENSVDFQRMISLIRELNIEQEMSVEFLRTLIGGVNVFERVFNSELSGDLTLARAIMLSRFMNLELKGATDLDRTVFFERSFNIDQRGEADFLRDFIQGLQTFERFFNPSMLGTAGFSRDFIEGLEVFERVFNVGSLMNIDFFRQAPFEIYERIFSILSRGAWDYKTYIRSWEEVKPYETCAMLMQIGESRAYLCIYTDGDYKILIKGV